MVSSATSTASRRPDLGIAQSIARYAHKQTRLPHHARLSLPHVPLHIIQRGNNRQACFFVDDDYRFYLDWLGRHDDQTGCRVHACVLKIMHLLISIEHAKAPGALMKWLGQRHVQYVTRACRRSGKTLFTNVTGGIRFDSTDASATLSDAKGWQLYSQNYLNAFTLAEHQIVERLLPAATDWFIQAGSVSMSATDTPNQGAFKLGGASGDTTNDDEWRIAA